MNQKENEIALKPKDQFVNNVKQWVLLDSQLKIVNEKTKVIRETKRTLSDEICNFMKENELTNNKIKISDGELRLYDKKEYSPLTFGYIERTLKTIIQDEAQANFIVNYLKEQREITNSLDIRRTYNRAKP